MTAFQPGGVDQTVADLACKQDCPTRETSTQLLFWIRWILTGKHGAVLVGEPPIGQELVDQCS